MAKFHINWRFTASIFRYYEKDIEADTIEQALKKAYEDIVKNPDLFIREHTNDFKHEDAIITEFN